MGAAHGPVSVRSQAAKRRQPALICIENVIQSRRPIANPSVAASQLRPVPPICRSATHPPGARVESPTGGESRFQVPATLASTGGPKRLPVPPQTNPLPAPEGPLRQWHPARRRQPEEVLESSISSEQTSRAAGTQVAQSGNLCHHAMT